MATVKGILGQASPNGGVLTNIYTVPASKNATVKVIFANRGTAATPVRLAVSPNGAAISLEQYLTYDFVLAAKDAVSSVVFTAGSSDIVRVQSGNGEVSFTCTGLEQDN